MILQQTELGKIIGTPQACIYRVLLIIKNYLINFIENI